MEQSADNSNRSTRRPYRTVDGIRHFLCGLAMGAADAVPGVSGGTVALVLGIYSRLVRAVSQVDADALTQLRQRNWRGLAHKFDTVFLVVLLAGVAVGLITFVVVLRELIGEPDAPAATRSYVYAIFFGAICGSGYLVARMIRPANVPQRVVCGVLALLGGGFAYWLTSLDALEEFSSAPNPLLAFVLGAIAICAMILPGISGSYLLLIFGAYHYFSGIPKAIAKGQLVVQDVFAFGCFAFGCLVGLLSFAKLLRWMLNRYEALTLSLMGGFMIGALGKLWPWQGDEPAVPTTLEKWICYGLIVFTAIVVIVVDYLVRPNADDPLPSQPRNAA